MERTKTFIIKLSEEEYDHLDKLSHSDRKSKSGYVRDLLNNEWQRQRELIDIIYD